MVPNLTKYQKIVLDDVESQDYERQRKLIWIGFFTICAGGLGFYLALIVRKLSQMNFDVSKLIIAYVRDPKNPDMTTLFFHETSVLILGFIMAIVVFGLLGFLIYDLQQRNSLIQKILNNKP